MLFGKWSQISLQCLLNTHQSRLSRQFGLAVALPQHRYKKQLSYIEEIRIQTPDRNWLICIKHAAHPPLSQRAERRAEAERGSSRSAVASGHFPDDRFLLRGLDLVSRTRAGLDVEVFQDVVVDLGGDPLLLQHLLDRLVCGVGPDRGTLLRGSSGL